MVLDMIAHTNIQHRALFYSVSHNIAHTAQKAQRSRKCKCKTFRVGLIHVAESSLASLSRDRGLPLRPQLSLILRGKGKREHSVQQMGLESPENLQGIPRVRLKT